MTAVTAAEPRMHPLTLLFPADWERRFRDGTAARVLLQSRVSLTIALVNLTGVGAWFTFTVPAEQGGRAIGTLFFLSAVPAALVLLTSFTTAFARYSRPLSGGALLGSGLAQAAVAVVLPTPLGATVACVSAMVVLFFGFIFMGTGFAVALPVGSIVVAAALATTAAAGAGWAFTSTFWLGLFSALGGAAGAGYFVEHALRRDFVRQRLLDSC